MTRQEIGWRMAGVWVAVAWLTTVSAPAYAAQTGPAVAVVRHFQNTLIAVMKAGKSLGFKGRYGQLMPAVHKSHDVAYIAQLTLGPYWGRLTPAEQQAFVRAFTKLTVATYAAQFRRYSGQAFRRVTSQEVAQGDVLVETELTTHGRKDATIDYLVAPTGGHWEIVNIVANGVSDLALKRAQYTAIIRKKGFPALLATLRDKVAQLSHGAVKG
ncbi:ABC transporter substrate-binding protein [Acidiferrobacter thiooxydans]|uniref:ABC transporter substrate-binding protein n=1 Tax=Acidiferrobacter thiooxydans TaxID=163359 RepID=UPI0008254DB3|nr:ABC transporter substrate-binding protein [Acidiferrobacter thiooxydans]MDA8191642.1 ABC transporter substrate-binding protein [Gammaproteobacteria bacterium]UEN98973.1 ABC transporter substrate-binding protein [Acidiferrobacter thiooxydans]